VNDVSRLSRNVGYILKVVELLEGHGITVHSVAQNLGSQDASFRLMLTLFAMV
jgi:DNA invertase Pin-like site-specific DNA recombinase